MVGGVVFKLKANWRRLAPAVVIALAIVIGVSILAMNDRHTHRQLKQTRTELAFQQSRANSINKLLYDEINKSTKLTKDLADTKKLLTTKLGDLSSAQGLITNQTESIHTLKSCLDGVTLALVQASNNDPGAAQTTLDSVSDACTRSQQLLSQ